ncbi:MAG: T9SS type A sorting domain-containing protein [Ignavibacteria bacterium]
MKNILTALILFFCTEADAQWFTQQSGTTSPLYDIEFINDKTGWCCGEEGYIIKTTNGGINWIRQGQGVTSRPLYGIHPVDSNTVFAAGLFRDIVKTTNGGADWILIQSGGLGDGTYTCTFFINENTGWFGNFDGLEYGVRKTTDGGQTIFTSPFLGHPEDLYFKDSLNGIGVSGASQIHKTSNGGENWHTFAIAPSGDFYRVSFINDNTGFTASHRAVFRTTDFGNTWDSIGNIPAIVSSIDFASCRVGYAGTSYSILKSNDSGSTWTAQVSTGVVYSIESYNDTLIWTCGNAGRIWHTSNGGVSFVENNSTKLPDSFTLHQNYPNPFNSFTRFDYEIAEPGMYSLKVYDLRGKEIRELFNMRLTRGVYSITYDAGELSSGIYFYTMSNNLQQNTLKMLVLK